MLSDWGVDNLLPAVKLKMGWYVSDTREAAFNY